MPLLKIAYTHPFESQAVEEKLVAEGTRVVVEVMGKPERFVMVLAERERMAFGGSMDPCAFLELRSLGGLGDEINAELTLRLCEMMRDVAEVPMDRTFVNFIGMERTDWGWNGGTFARPRGL